MRCFTDFDENHQFKVSRLKKMHIPPHVHFADLQNTFEQRNLHYNPYQPELDFRLYMNNVARKPVWLMMAEWACQCQQLEAHDVWMTAQWAFSSYIWKSRSLDDIHINTSTHQHINRTT